MMVDHMLGLYLKDAQAVAGQIGIDAYFIDERLGRIVRREPDGTLSLLKLSLNTAPRGSDRLDQISEGTVIKRELHRG